MTIADRPHPGTIVFEDTIAGTREEQSVAQVPDHIAFVEVDGERWPVVRVVMSGDDRQRCIESFGEDGRLLSVTTGSVG